MGDSKMENIYIYIKLYIKYIYIKLTCGNLRSGDIYIYICRFAELDYLVEDIYCYSEFHAPCGAIIRQLPKITDTYEDVQNLKIQNNA